MNRILLASAAVLGLALASPALAAHGDHHGHDGGANAAAPAGGAPSGGGWSGHHDNGGSGGSGGGWHHHDGNGGGANAFGGGGGDRGWHHHDNNGGGNDANPFAGGGSANPFAGGSERHHRDRGGDNNGWNHDNGGSRWNGGGAWRGDHDGHGDSGRGRDHFGGRHGGWSGFNRAFNAPHRYHWGSYHRPYGWYYQRWALGAFLPGLFWDRQYWIDDYNDFDLDDPPPGTVWVRYGNDALLIDEDTGEVIQVVYGIFY